MKIQNKLLELTNKIQDLVDDKYDSKYSYYPAITISIDKDGVGYLYFVSVNMYEVGTVTPTHSVHFNMPKGENKKFSANVFEGRCLIQVLSALEDHLKYGLKDLRKIHALENHLQADLNKLQMPRV